MTQQFDAWTWRSFSGGSVHSLSVNFNSTVKETWNFHSLCCIVKYKGLLLFIVLSCWFKHSIIIYETLRLDIQWKWIHRMFTCSLAAVCGAMQSSYIFNFNISYWLKEARTLDCIVVKEKKLTSQWKTKNIKVFYDPSRWWWRRVATTMLCCKS